MPAKLQMVRKGGESVDCDMSIHRIKYLGRAALLVEFAPCRDAKREGAGICSAPKKTNRLRDQLRPVRGKDYPT